MTAEGDALEVNNADTVTLLIALETTFGGGRPAERCDQQVAAAVPRGYPALRSRHVADHQPLFQRVALELGGSSSALLPTDQRLERVRRGPDDPALAAQFFQYGRYLLIAASREDSPLPANLQGLGERYRFTGDREFLHRRAYPILKEAAEFFLDNLVEEPKHGWLVTGPSTSPENAFVAPDGQGACSESMGPTCDIVLVRDLFKVLRGSESDPVCGSRISRPTREGAGEVAAVADRLTRAAYGVARGLRGSRAQSPAHLPPDRSLPQRPDYPPPAPPRTWRRPRG